MTEYIFLDLETTGVDPVKDKIIEIGAIKVNKNLDVIDRYHSLVNPEIHIPSFITMLTGGFNDELVRNAPVINDIKKSVLNFIGDTAIIAHNAAFEEKFLLSQLSGELLNPFVDSMDIIALFFPTASSLKLDTIIKLLSIRPEGETHRAFEDAEDLYKVILYIREMINNDPSWFLVARHIVSSMKTESWIWADILSEMLPVSQPMSVVERSDNINNVNCELKLSDYKLDFDSLISLIKYPLENRKEQNEYMKYIVESFNTNSSIFIEAGTGTGKTLAYLLPAFKWASDNKSQVVISTKTKTLQNQIIENDVPLVKRLLENSSVNVTKIQGRNNYLCIRKMERMYADIDLTDDFESKYAKLFLYSVDKLSEVADLTKVPAWIKRNYPYISRIINVLSADSASCLQSKCLHYEDCHYFNMIRDAKKAAILIANHSLIMNWPSHLPRGERIIFDEAHNLEKESTSATTLVFDSFFIINLMLTLYDIDKNRGLLPQLRRVGIEIPSLSDIETSISYILELERLLKESVKDIFIDIYSKVNKKTSFQYTEELIICSPTSRQGAYDVLNDRSWNNCLENLNDIKETFKKLVIYLSEISKNKLSETEFSMIVDTIVELIQDRICLLEDTISLNKNIQEDIPYVYWVSWDEKKNSFSFSRALLDVGSKLASDVYPNYLSSIFTSATLKAGTHNLSKNIGFDRINGNIYNNELISINSPFDYENNSALCFLKDTTVPYKSNFVPDLTVFVADIAEILDGRTLVLFSSIKRMNDCYKLLSAKLEEKGYKVFMQGMGADVIEYFKSEPKSILLGSESFGEGLDIKGEELSCVILERFPVIIKDPVYIAREELFKHNNNTSSYEYFELPQRLLKLRQWSGRLIRSNTDKGIVIVYDNWFNQQTDKIKRSLADSVYPMPVLISSVYDIKKWIKNKFQDWKLI